MHEKLFGIIILFIAVLLSTAVEISRTSFSVLDTDPTTYVIVAMLMLFTFIVFSLKEDLSLNRDRSQIAIGVAIFIAYLLILSFVRTEMSFVFMSFGLGALLVSLPILSFSIILFGKDGIRKLWPIAAYSLFASPLLLMPILLQNAAFANANAQFVYSMLKLFGAPVTIKGISIVSSAVTSISIASTCAPVGTFIAIVMFLIPVAYLYNGRFSRKVAWVASGLGLMLLFNFARMFGIAYSWSYYGLTKAIAIFHLFAGQIFFYAAIIIMLLIAYKYGLLLRGTGKAKRRKPRIIYGIRSAGYGFVIVLALGVVAFLFTLPYLKAIYVSPMLFYRSVNQSDNIALYRLAGSEIAASYPSLSGLGANGTRYAFVLENLTDSDYNTYIIAEYATPPSSAGLMVNTSGWQYGAASYILQNGVRLGVTTVVSGNYTFAVDYFTIPEDFGSGALSMSYEFFRLLRAHSGSCEPPSYQSIGLFNYVESVISNALHGHVGYNPDSLICSAYSVASSAG